jgi:hypothetical protein
MSNHSRRAFLYSLAAASAASLSASFTVHRSASAQTYAKPARRLQVARKSAAKMTSREIDLFKRGFDLLIKKRVMDELILAHSDMTQEQHEVAPNVLLLTFHLMPYPGGERFLAWHRAFLLEFELALRRAIYEEYGSGPLNEVYVPYWDASHMTDMPDWLKDYKPAGMRARSVEGLPPGHPGFGVPVYEVQIARYPGSYAIAPKLPAAEHVRALLALSDYTAFTRRLEWAPTIGRTASASELAQLRVMAGRVTDPAVNYNLLADVLAAGRLTVDQETVVFHALLRLESALMDASYIPGVNLQAVRELLNYAMQFYLLGPHTGIHTWVAGHNNLVKGTALYFHETAADPAFWMLHAEVDRIWNTWQTRWPGRPNLQGQDALFKPWANGRTWTLNQLLDTQSLPYRYDQLYEA